MLTWDLIESSRQRPGQQHAHARRARPILFDVVVSVLLRSCASRALRSIVERAYERAALSVSRRRAAARRGATSYLMNESAVCRLCTVCSVLYSL